MLYWCCSKVLQPILCSIFKVADKNLFEGATMHYKCSFCQLTHNYSLCPRLGDPVWAGSEMESFLSCQLHLRQLFETEWFFTSSTCMLKPTESLLQFVYSITYIFNFADFLHTIKHFSMKVVVHQ